MVRRGPIGMRAKADRRCAAGRASPESHRQLQPGSRRQVATAPSWRICWRCCSASRTARNFGTSISPRTRRDDVKSRSSASEREFRALSHQSAPAIRGHALRSLQRSRSTRADLAAAGRLCLSAPWRAFCRGRTIAASCPPTTRCAQGWQALSRHASRRQASAPTRMSPDFSCAPPRPILRLGDAARDQHRAAPRRSAASPVELPTTADTSNCASGKTGAYVPPIPVTDELKAALRRGTEEKPDHAGQQRG